MKANVNLMPALRNVCALSIAVAVAGCGGRTAIGGAPDLKVVSSTQLPAPSVADLGASTRPYRVGPLDQLNIDVFGAEDLKNREIQVDASGRISYPLVGTVEVAGKTPGEIETILQDLLRRRFIRDPHVTVNLKEIVSQMVTVGGEVTEPGMYPVVGRMTLLRAIARAKGLSDYSKKSEVVVFHTVNGQQYAALYDVNKIEQGAYPDPEIYANDVISVGEASTRRLFKDLVLPLIAPLVILLRN